MSIIKTADEWLKLFIKKPDKFTQYVKLDAQKWLDEFSLDCFDYRVTIHEFLKRHASDKDMYIKFIGNITTKNGSYGELKNYDILPANEVKE